jgi:hypothetical protein
VARLARHLQNRGLESPATVSLAAASRSISEENPVRSTCLIYEASFNYKTLAWRRLFGFDWLGNDCGGRCWRDGYSVHFFLQRGDAFFGRADCSQGENLEDYEHEKKEEQDAVELYHGLEIDGF